MFVKRQQRTIFTHEGGEQQEIQENYVMRSIIICMLFSTNSHYYEDEIGRERNTQGSEHQWIQWPE